MNTIARTLIVAFAVNSFAGCASAPTKVKTIALRPWQKPLRVGYIEQSVDAFGINFVLRAWPSSNPTVPENVALGMAVKEIQRISQMADESIPGSEVSLINQKATEEAVSVSQELADLLIEADKMYQISDKRFDVTFTPYQAKTELTDWDQLGMVSPSSLHLFGEKNMLLDLKPSPQVRFYRKGTKLNLKGMVRGYAVESAMGILGNQGLGGMSIVADGFFSAMGTPLRDPAFMCIENPKNLGTCGYKISVTDLKNTLFFGTSASQERPGKIFDPRQGWSFRSGGVTVAGTEGAWVQFGTTITTVMDDRALESFFSKMKSRPLVGTYFVKHLNGTLEGSLAPLATTTRI